MTTEKLIFIVVLVISTIFSLTLAACLIITVLRADDPTTIWKVALPALGAVGTSIAGAYGYHVQRTKAKANGGSQ